MATDELARLVAAIERHTPADGVCDTAVPGLLLGRQLTPTDPIALVVDPSLCIVAQGAKEVFLAGEVYRYDPAHSLLVSIDLPISARVVEASPPGLAWRCASPSTRRWSANCWPTVRTPRRPGHPRGGST